MLDLAVDLGKRLFATHGQHGVTEAHEHNDQGEMADPCSVQPAQRFFVHLDYARMQRIRRKLYRSSEDREPTPNDQDHHHDSGDDHDLHGFLTGFVNALDVFPPEVKHYQSAEDRRETILRKVSQRVAEVAGDVFHETG